ncbi:MAG: hypothetical protein GY679_04335 [Mycoplasma sp.]|nr:hypothetical protein [Mycoplasma sp.]
MVSCNPCKYVSKHQECFPADTVVITKETVHYEKEYITNDSIIRDTVLCDPILKTYYKTNTVYKTNFKLKVDTIYTSKEISKINPVNEQLKKANDKLIIKLKLRDKIMIVLSILVLTMGIWVYIRR